MSLVWIGIQREAAPYKRTVSHSRVMDKDCREAGPGFLLGGDVIALMVCGFGKGSVERGTGSYDGVHMTSLNDIDWIVQTV